MLGRPRLAIQAESKLERMATGGEAECLVDLNVEALLGIRVLTVECAD